MSEKEELSFYKTAIGILTQNGYMQYEVSNFARQHDYISRHNVKYWNHTNYIGFGPSAHSFWFDRRWSNSPSIHNYIKNLNNGLLPDRTDEAIDAETKEFEKIFLSLRTNDGLNLSEFEELFKYSFVEKYKIEIDRLLNAGLARIKNNSLSLTPEGLYLCDEIISDFAHI